MTSHRVALVTGANQGIGKSIVEQLLQHDTSLIVLLGSRNRDNGNNAVDEIKQKYNITNHRLQPIHIDLNSVDSIVSACDTVRSQYSRLDLLINNAGWASKGSTINEKIAHDTLEINYYGTKHVIDHFIPLMSHNNTRIINVSSTSSAYALRDMSKQHRAQFLDDNLTVEKLESLLHEFIDAVKQDKITELGML